PIAILAFVHVVAGSHVDPGTLLAYLRLYAATIRAAVDYARSARFAKLRSGVVASLWLAAGALAAPYREGQGEERDTSPVHHAPQRDVLTATGKNSVLLVSLHTMPRFVRTRPPCGRMVTRRAPQDWPSIKSRPTCGRFFFANDRRDALRPARRSCKEPFSPASRAGLCDVVVIRAPAGKGAARSRCSVLFGRPSDVDGRV